MDRVVTQAQARIIEQVLNGMLAVSAIGKVGNHSRTFRLSSGSVVRGAEHFATALKMEYAELSALKIKTLAAHINKYLSRRVGNMYRQNGNGKQQKTIQRLAQAELKRRLGQMSVSELAVLAK